MQEDFGYCGKRNEIHTAVKKEIIRNKYIKNKYHMYVNGDTSYKYVLFIIIMNYSK